MSEYLFFIFPTHDWYSAILQLLLQKLVYCERDSLAGRYAHDSRCDPFVEGVESFLSIVHSLAKFPNSLPLPPRP